MYLRHGIEVLIKREKNDKLSFIKNKHTCASEGTIKKKNMQVTGWEKMFTIPILD